MDREGGPLAVAVAGANTPDFRLLPATLDAVVPARPAPTAAAPQELYGDRGYDHWTCDEAAVARGSTVRIARRSGGWVPVDAPPPPDPPQYRERRWLVERTLAWFSKCRGLLVRYEKKAINHLGFLKVAAILLWYRRAVRNRDS